jgi:hypothetical protein
MNNQYTAWSAAHWENFLSLSFRVVPEKECIAIAILFQVVPEYHVEPLPNHAQIFYSSVDWF